MCDTCGCGQPEDYTVNVPGEQGKPENTGIQEHYHEHGEHDHEHHHHHKKHKHDHDHEHSHGHHPADHENEHHEHDHSHERRIEVSRDILSENNLMAERNRGYFEGRNILCLNLVSSPGSGKTTILEKTIEALKPKLRLCVIEGDQQSMNDAERIMNSGAPVVQINTGSGCHLDARMVNSGLRRLDAGNDAVLFIENVGNLVCPALFDLGEKKRVVVISVTEGEDKPLKYPYMFASSHLCLVNKSDLLPYVDFNVEKTIEYARRANPRLEFITLSAKTGEGMTDWFTWIDQNR